MANQIRRSQWRLPESTTGQGRRGPDQRAVANFHFDRPPYVNHDIAVHNRVSDIEACAQVGVRQYGSVLNYAAAIDLTVVLNIRAACDDHTRPQSCVLTYVCGTHDASPRMQARAWPLRCGQPDWGSRRSGSMSCSVDSLPIMAMSSGPLLSRTKVTGWPLAP